MRIALILFAVIVLALAVFLAFDQWWPGGEGRIIVLSDPPGAQIWLDLQPTSVTTNGILLKVRQGQHSITIRKDTLEAYPFAQIIQVRPRSVDTLHFQLVPPQIAKKLYAARPAEPARPSPQVPPITEDVLERERTSARLDTTPYVTLTPVKPGDTLRTPRQTQETRGTSGQVEISSSFMGAQIFVNGELRPEVTPAKITLPAGTYSLRVALEGYIADPRELTVFVNAQPKPQLVFFTLTEARAHELVVTTTPIAAPIYLDSVLVGRGKVILPRDFGVYTIHFGDSTGWRTPEPLRVTLTPSKPRPEFEGIYVRTLHISAQANGETSVVTDGGINWETGVYYNHNTVEPSASLGARIREIPGSKKFGWELAVGDPNRNPTGGDYVEFTFTLPSDIPPTTALDLRLYLYRSDKLYPFVVTGRCDLAVSVNGKIFLDGLRPVNTTEGANEQRFERWSLQGMLKEGENKIMVRSGDHNSQYSYLWKIEIQ
jgi:hypothetical protein